MTLHERKAMRHCTACGQERLTAVWFIVLSIVALPLVPFGVVLSLMWDLVIGICVTCYGVAVTWLAFYAARRASVCPACGDRP
jgi:hypothetical protein